jgi:hypothetical protein
LAWEIYLVGSGSKGAAAAVKEGKTRKLRVTKFFDFFPAAAAIFLPLSCA